MTNPYVDENHDAKQESRKVRLEERADNAEAKSQALSNKADEMASVIPTGQPILVGHHSEHRDRRYRDRIHNTYGKSVEEQKKAEELKERAASAGTGGISTNDPTAIEQLETKLTEAETLQEHMKAVNKAIRKGNDQTLRDMGLSDTAIAEIKKPDFCGRIGYPGYALTNNNANMKRMRDRIAVIKRLRESAPLEIKSDAFELITEDGYFRLYFQRKPTAAVRDKIKSHGFRWSGYNQAWQRKVTNNAAYAAKACAEELKNMGDLYT